MLRPSKEELRWLFPSLVPAQVALLLDDPEGSGQDPLTTYDLLRVAVFDWMLRNKVFAIPAQQQLTLFKFNPSLKLFAGWYECDEQVNGTQRPVGSLAFIDQHFVTIHLPGRGKPGGFYDIHDNDWRDVMPYHGLTTVACDLSVLLLRVLARIVTQRNIQTTLDKRHDPDRRPTAQDAPDQPPGPPTDVAG